MNLNDLQKALQNIMTELGEEITSKEQYIAAKKRLDELREDVRKNPFIAMLGDTIITPVSREIERAYKAFTSPSAQTPSYEGFDLVNDPKAMEKVRQYLDTLEASASSMTQQQLKSALDPLIKLSDELKHLKPENAEEKQFAQETTQRVLKLLTAVEHAQQASETIRVVTDEPEAQAAPLSSNSSDRETIKVYTEVEYEYRYQETQFDIFADDFMEKYRAYLEDVALNSSNKKVPELLQDGKTLKIIGEDLYDIIPQTDEEEDFLNEVKVQTPLLLKIVDRNIAQKSAPAKPKTPSPSPKAKKSPSRSSKPAAVADKTDKTSSKATKKVPLKTAKSAKKEVSKPAVKKSKIK